MSEQSRDRGDEGSALILVLAFMMAFAVLSVVLLGKAQVNVTTSRVVREQEARVAAANAGIDFGVQRLRADSTLCSDPAAGTMTIPSAGLNLINGRPTVQVTCTATSGSSIGGGGWALYVGSGGISTSGGGQKTINGAVYNGGGWSLNGNDISIEDGPLATPTCTAVGGLLTDPAFPRQCPVTVPIPAPTQTFADMQVGLETALPPAANAPALSGTCKVFSPGTYTGVPPVVNAGNYFQSGVYVLDNIGEWVLDETVIAGQPPSSETRTLSVPAACAGASDPVNTVPGVVFIMTGNSRITVKQGAIELFSRPMNGKPGVSIYQVRGTEGGVWAAKAQTLGLSTPVVQFGNGAQPEFVAHGLVYAPDGFVSLQQTNSALANAFGGVVAAGVQLDVSNSAPNGLVISNGTGPGQRIVVVRSVVTPVGSEKQVEASVIALIPNNDPLKTASLGSWTVINP